MLQNNNQYQIPLISSLYASSQMNKMLTHHINNNHQSQSNNESDSWTSSYYEGQQQQYYHQTGIQENFNENIYYSQIQKYQQEYNQYQNQSNNYIQTFYPQQQQQQQLLPSFGNEYQQQNHNNYAKEQENCESENASVCDEVKSQINSSTSIHNSNDASTCCFSFHQIPNMMSPSNNTPKIQKAGSFKINSLSHIQDNYCENQNQASTLQLDQTNYQTLTPSKSSSSQSNSPQTFSSQIQVAQSRYNGKINSSTGNTTQEGESENRRIIQTYQKISKININKNIIKAFKKFMLDKDNSDIITSFGIINESKNQCKQMKIFFDSLNHNNHSVTKIIDHELYGGAFEFFLTFYAESWLKSSRVQDKQAHFVAIDFFKLCCTENKVKLSNFKYYSKRKTDNNNNNSLSQSSIKQESCQTIKNCGSDMSYLESDNNVYSEDNSQTNI